jgi:hypothetical protein
MIGGPNGQPSGTGGVPAPDTHHSGLSEGHGPSQAHAIAQMQHHQQEAMQSGQLMGPGGPHEQPLQQQPPPGSGGGQMPGQPGSAPGQFPPGRGPTVGPVPMMMYPQHMNMVMPGPPPNLVPNGGGPPQGGPPVYMGGPPPPYMVPMMPGMPAHHAGPMSGAPMPQPQQQPPPHSQQFNGPMGPPMVPPMPAMVPMLPGGAMVQQHPGVGGKPAPAMGAAGPRFAGQGQSGGSVPAAPGSTPRNTTTLRASAPSFVPGSFKPAAAETKAPPGACL